MAIVLVWGIWIDWREIEPVVGEKCPGRGPEGGRIKRFILAVGPASGEIGGMEEGRREVYEGHHHTRALPRSGRGEKASSIAEHEGLVPRM